MIKKIQEFIKRKSTEKKQNEDLIKAKKYYEILQSGALFLQYIREDLNKEVHSVNRSMRRRMEKQLEKTGKFNKEIIDHYKDKVDNILKYIEINKNKEKK